MEIFSSIISFEDDFVALPLGPITLLLLFQLSLVMLFGTKIATTNVDTLVNDVPQASIDNAPLESIIDPNDAKMENMVLVSPHSSENCLTGIIFMYLTRRPLKQNILLRVVQLMQLFLRVTSVSLVISQKSRNLHHFLRLPKINGGLILSQFKSRPCKKVKHGFLLICS